MDVPDWTFSTGEALLVAGVGVGMGSASGLDAGSLVSAVSAEPNCRYSTVAVSPPPRMPPSRAQAMHIQAARTKNPLWPGSCFPLSSLAAFFWFGRGGE